MAPIGGKRTAKGFTLIELMIVVAIIGVLAAVAVPSFMKYMRKSKTAEARQFLQKIYSQARVYYLETYGAPQAGLTVPHQFPKSVALTPAESCCLGGLDKCTPSAALWTDPTWIALHFSVDDGHYYRYEFVSSGVGTTSQFTARAMGDLDCDGKLSTFELYGTITSDGGDVTGLAGMARINELE